jgi:exopolysaccharide biosynthesis protein
MKTMHHQYLARIFYTDETIQKVQDSNYFIAIDEDTNTEDIGKDEQPVEQLNEYEKELLTPDEGNDLYKVLDIKVGGSNAYLVGIYDPTKVKLIRTKAFNIGTTGERILTMCPRYGGVVCINAGGFEDNGWGSDRPTGYVIEDSKVIWPSSGDGSSFRTSIIGLTADGKLKLMSNTTADEAIASGVVEGLNFEPFLIVNGKSLEIVGDPWGKAPRVAIAQRKDGVMMFLVIDGENYINGASLKEMIEVLERYGAYNAANLDGGQSSSLVINGKLYNTPPPAAKAQGGRYVVTGFGLIP